MILPPFSNTWNIYKVQDKLGFFTAKLDYTDGETVTLTPDHIIRQTIPKCHDPLLNLITMAPAEAQTRDRCHPSK